MFALVPVQTGERGLDLLHYLRGCWKSQMKLSTRCELGLLLGTFSESVGAEEAGFKVVGRKNSGIYFGKGLLENPADHRRTRVRPFLGELGTECIILRGGRRGPERPEFCHLRQNSQKFWQDCGVVSLW